MGERAKVILNEYSAKNLLMRDTLDLDKFYSADLKLFVKVAKKEIERLNKELEVAKTNEETYRLEMLDITKRLGLDEETLFDDVKDKAERLNNIINEFEKWLKAHLDDEFYWFKMYDKLQELKGNNNSQKGG